MPWRRCPRFADGTQPHRRTPHREWHWRVSRPAAFCTQGEARDYALFFRWPEPYRYVRLQAANARLSRHRVARLHPQWPTHYRDDQWPEIIPVRRANVQIQTPRRARHLGERVAAKHRRHRRRRHAHQEHAYRGDQSRSRHHLHSHRHPTARQTQLRLVDQLWARQRK